MTQIVPKMQMINNLMMETRPFYQAITSRSLNIIERKEHWSLTYMRVRQS